MSALIALFMLPGLLIGLTFHEFAHAWSASLLGDDYPRRRGRVSLNPFHHLSLLGTLAIFLLPIGWAKPVEVNVYNFRRPKRDFLLSSLAGPAANLLLFGLCILAMQFTRRSFLFGPRGEHYMLLAHVLLKLGAIINVMLAVFNLLPIPPLDGSKIWPCLIPGLKLAQGRGTTWLFILVLLVLVWTDSLHPLVDGIIRRAEVLMPETDSDVFQANLDAGVAAFNADRLGEARRRLDAAIAVNPYSDQAYSWRAAVRADAKDHRGAVQDILRALELAPRTPTYHMQAAEYFDALGDKQQAKAHRDSAARLQPPTTRPATAPARRK